MNKDIAVIVYRYMHHFRLKILHNLYKNLFKLKRNSIGDILCCIIMDNGLKFSTIIANYRCYKNNLDGTAYWSNKIVTNMIKIGINYEEFGCKNWTTVAELPKNY
jgi:hypothetical protein